MLLTLLKVILNYMGYFRDAFTGIKWMGMLRGVTRMGAFVRIAILARILTPSQFGVYGVASLMLVLLETITQTGINVFLIQEKKRLEEYVNTAWVVSIIRGFFITAILLFVSPFVSQFFKSPESVSLLRLIAMVALIRGFINPSRVRFMKDLNFKNEFWFSLIIFLIDTSVTVAVSIIYSSPVGLVWGLIVGAIVEVVLSIILIKPRPKFIFEMNKIKDVLSKGKWVTGAAILDYSFEQGDDMVVAKLLNTSSLGIYQQAYKLSTLPLTEVTRVFNQVTFPVYSNIAGDVARLRSAFIKTTFVLMTIIVPIGIFLYLFSEPIVLVLLGNNWFEVIPVLKILALFGILRAFTVSVIPLLNSLKLQKYVTLITLSQFLVMGITIVPLITSKGTTGAAISVLIASLLTIPVTLYLIFRELKLFGK
jgi:O-antigen/teichoic acid export membrane protein